MMKTYPESDPLLFLLRSNVEYRDQGHTVSIKREMAASPGQFIALQDFNVLKEAILGHGTFQIVFILTADSRSLYS